jgi:hypothetical protein
MNILNHHGIEMIAPVNFATDKFLSLVQRSMVQKWSEVFGGGGVCIDCWFYETRSKSGFDVIRLEIWIHHPVSPLTAAATSLPKITIFARNFLFFKRRHHFGAKSRWYSESARKNAWKMCITFKFLQKNIFDLYAENLPKNWLSRFCIRWN